MLHIPALLSKHPVISPLSYIPLSVGPRFTAMFDIAAFNFGGSHYLLSLVSFMLTMCLFVYFCWGLGQRPKDYPPGPATLPFIGNLHQMPREQGHKQFQKWANEYGPIYSLIIGNQTLVVLSSDYDIKELLVRRGSNYSSRPDSYLSHDILSGGLRVVFMVCVYYISL
jgi:hypothetical protein